MRIQIWGAVAAATWRWRRRHCELLVISARAGKRPAKRREVPRFGELALRVWVRELHGGLTSGTGLPVLFCSKDIAILQCFKSICLRAFDRTLPNQSQPESSFAPHATAAKRHFRRLCASPATPRRAVLRRRRVHTNPSQGQGAGKNRLSGRRHPTREPRRNKEDQGLRRVRTDGGPPDEGSGATQ